MAKGVKITGDKRLMRMLQELPRRPATAANRRAVALATTPILQAVKSECPVDQGDLRRAQTKKITSRGGRANGIVGADANYTAAAGTGGKLTKDEAAAHKAGGGELKVPSKYDHLVAFGHATRGGGQTTPNPYIQRGWDESIGTAQAKFEAELAAGIEQAAARLGGR